MVVIYSFLIYTTAFSYDGLGRLAGVSSGPAAADSLLDVRYGYTLQGWTASIRAAVGGRTVFSEELGYDGTPASATGGPSYTGLITRKQETWSVPTGPTQVQSVSRTEDYAYDYAARLASWDDSADGEDLLYDSRGNITSRTPRYGSGGTVTMTYAGDRLATFKEGSSAAVAFAHDAFARMTTDALAGLTIAYNPFNMPEQVSAGTTLKARYTYTADGTKVAALDASGEGLVYRGPFTYRRSSDGTLSFESAPFARGRLTGTGVRYHLTDHLGSIRAVIDGSASTTAYPQTGFYSMDDYRPFGERITSAAASSLTLAPTGPAVSLRDSFTGKEDQGPDFAIPYTDFGARHYGTALQRWLVPDPLGEKYYDISPYVYCSNNPVNRIDASGRDDYRYDDETGTFYLMNSTNDKTDRVLAYHKNKDTGEYEPNNRLFQNKIRIKDIEKGILKNGINFKEQDNVIQVGAEGQPSVEGVEEFIIDLSEMVDLEIAGFEYSLRSESAISHVYIGRYQSSKDPRSRWNTDHAASVGFSYWVSGLLPDAVTFHVQFHTHLSRFSNDYKLKPSSGPNSDLEYKETQRGNGIKKFIILTKGYDPIEY